MDHSQQFISRFESAWFLSNRQNLNNADGGGAQLFHCGHDGVENRRRSTRSNMHRCRNDTPRLDRNYASGCVCRHGGFYLHTNLPNLDWYKAGVSQ